MIDGKLGFELALNAICEKYSLKIMNIGDYILNIDRKYLIILPKLSFDSYIYTLLNNDFIFSIIPLGGKEEDPNIFKFNNSKSNIKYKHYGMSKIPGIYSNTEVYRDVIVNENNGLLVDNIYSQWYNSMESLIFDKNFRSKIAENAFTDVICNYGINFGVNKLLLLLNYLYCRFLFRMQYFL
jgi:hypothetical protein